VRNFGEGCANASTNDWRISNENCGAQTQDDCLALRVTRYALQRYPRRAKNRAARRW